jgi:hypothetical protein
MAVARSLFASCTISGLLRASGLGPFETTCKNYHSVLAGPQTKKLSILCFLKSSATRKHDIKYLDTNAFGIHAINSASIDIL